MNKFRTRNVTGVACYRVEVQDGVAVAIGSDEDEADGYGDVGGMFRTR